MKKVLAFCVVAVALILTGCTQDESQFNGFTINQGSSKEMVQGSSERLSMKVDATEDVKPVYTFVSSDPTAVDVDSTGVVYAMTITEAPVTITVTGSAVINNEKIEHTATIQISVIEFAQGLVFNDFYLMKSTESWQEEKYAIYIKRRNRAVEVPDGDDALVRTTRLEGDRDNLTAVFPEYDQWVHLYDTVAEDGSAIQVGLFLDSVKPYRAWLLSSDCFFDSDGAFQCASQGAVMEMFFAFMQDSKYAYVLGEREFIEDLTALDTIRPQGVEAMPFPGYLQTGHFDEDEYLEFWNEKMSGASPSISDFNFWAKYDTHIAPAGVDYDEEGAAYAYTLPLMGYPQAGGVINLASGEEYGSDAWLISDAYDFNATMYDNPTVGYCLKLETQVDPESGEEYLTYANPLQMADTKTVHYTKGTIENAPARVNRTPESDNTRPITIKSMNVRMNVVNTLGATFRMAVMK